MQRADGLDIEGGCLLKKTLNLCSVFAYDPDVIAACLVRPVLVRVQSAELAEPVGGEQYLLITVVGHDDFRPVYHWSCDEGQLVLAQGECISFCNDDLAVFKIRTEELLHHCKCLGGGYDLRILVYVHEIRYISGMVRLHVLYDQVVRPAGAGHCLDIIQPFVGETGVYRIHHGNLIVQNHIRIIRHAVLDYILALEQIYFMVVHTGVSDIVCNVHW